MMVDISVNVNEVTLLKKETRKGSGRTKRTIDEASGDVNNIVFPPKEKVTLTDEQCKELLKEGMEFRKAIEESAKTMVNYSTKNYRWD